MNTADVNRGYIKIEGAVRAFNFDFKDKVVLDIGSSTGGFTEIALEKGARKVIAVEKGTNQMKSPLRFDPRIDLHEKTDIFDTEVQKKPFEGPPEAGKPRMSAPRPWRRAEATQPELDILESYLRDRRWWKYSQVLRWLRRLCRVLGIH